MAEMVIMPRQGQSVESCIIVSWNVKEGDAVQEKDILCEVETDKAVFEVESPAAGTVLKILNEEGDEVPVLQTIAVIGQEGESFEITDESASGSEDGTTQVEADKAAETEIKTEVKKQAQAAVTGEGVSPRARNAAAKKGIDASSLPGSGPHGRVIERDVLAASQNQQPLTPAAKAALESGTIVPSSGSGIGGRVRLQDLNTLESTVSETESAAVDSVVDVPIKGVRKAIANNMMKSLSTTAQLTLNAKADASGLLAYRKKLKAAKDEKYSRITLNDMVLYAVSRVLSEHSEINCTVTDDIMHQYKDVHLAFATDTPKGLMVPVIRYADRLCLAAIASETKRLGPACVEGKVKPDELSGGTFTVTNLGVLGIENFTPVLNAPQAAILGVGAVTKQAVETEDGFRFVPYMSLSLTIDHRVIDGWPGGIFLKELVSAIENFEIVLSN